MKESDALFADIQQTSKLPMGDVRIGILPSAAHPLMTEVYRRLAAEFPKIRLNIREGQGGELESLLDTGSVDMAILFRYEKPSGSDEVLLATANTYLVSSPGLPLTNTTLWNSKSSTDSHWCCRCAPLIGDPSSTRPLAARASRSLLRSKRIHCERKSRSSPRTRICMHCSDPSRWPKKCEQASCRSQK